MRIMNDRRITGWMALLVAVMVVCGGCRSNRQKKELNKRISLSRVDDIPYGASVAYNQLSSLFPDADINVASKSPANLFNSYGKRAFIILGTRIEADGQDVANLKSWVSQGNHVFMSATDYSDTLLSSLHLESASSLLYGDSLQVSVLNPVSGDSQSFVYPGIRRDSYLTKLDTGYATVLGRDAQGRPNMVRFRYTGGGSLILQFAPLAFSNFFLLHKRNIGYYEQALSYIPKDVREVIWDDYFRLYHPRAGFQTLSFIFNNPALAAAFWLLLILLALIYIFESKRKQRPVPVIEGLRNQSLDFVKTIGRLYFQRRDNRNLVGKMANHFYDHIRTRYNMQSGPGEEEYDRFVERLSYKTGVRIEVLRELMGEMHGLLAGSVVSDEQLLAFDEKLEAFYKQA